MKNFIILTLLLNLLFGYLPSYSQNYPAYPIVSKYYYEDGSIYKGGIKNNLPHGIGLLITKDGKKKGGIWRNGQYIEGPIVGEIRNPKERDFNVRGYISGMIYEGELIIDTTLKLVKHGKGIVLLRDEVRYEGLWNNGETKYSGEGSIDKTDNWYRVNSEASISLYLLNGKLEYSGRFVDREFFDNIIYDGDFYEHEQTSEQYQSIIKKLNERANQEGKRNSIVGVYEAKDINTNKIFKTATGMNLYISFNENNDFLILAGSSWESALNNYKSNSNNKISKGDYAYKLDGKILLGKDNYFSGENSFDIDKVYNFEGSGKIATGSTYYFQFNNNLKLSDPL